MSNIKIKLHKLETNFVQFTISNIHIGLANGIRRILISDIPTMAIDFATIISNTGCLHDNMIAQRIGLIPFISKNAGKFNYYWDNQDNKLSEVEYQLNVINETDNILEVTSNDLKIIDNSNLTGYQKNIYNSVKPINMEYPIIITKLAKGQSLHFTCSVRKGISKEHAKFQPTSSVGYEIISNDTFKFTIESIGSLSPQSIVEKALDIFSDKLSKISENIN
jgi:DNA-directed RNA polymerase II subunit RPB3